MLIEMNSKENRKNVSTENRFSKTKTSNFEHQSQNHCHNEHNVLSCSKGSLNLRDTFRLQQSSFNRKRAGQEYDSISITTARLLQVSKQSYPTKKRCKFNCKNIEIINDVKPSSISFVDFDFNDSETSKIEKSRETSYESLIVETTRTKYYQLNDNEENAVGDNLVLDSICGKCNRRKMKKEREWSILPVGRLNKKNEIILKNKLNTNTLSDDSSSNKKWGFLQVEETANKNRFEMNVLNETESEIYSEDSFTICQVEKLRTKNGKNLEETQYRNSNRLSELNGLTATGSEIYSDDSFTIESILDNLVKDKKPMKNFLADRTPKSFCTKKLQFRIDSSTCSENDNFDMDSKIVGKYSKYTFDSCSSSTCSVQYSEIGTDDFVISQDIFDREIFLSADSIKSKNNLDTEISLSSTETTQNDSTCSKTALKLFFDRNVLLSSETEQDESNFIENDISDVSKSSRKLMKMVPFKSAPNLRVKLKIHSNEQLKNCTSDTKNSMSKQTNFESNSKICSDDSQIEPDSLAEINFICRKYSNDDTDVDESMSDNNFLDPCTSVVSLHKSEPTNNQPNFANKKTRKYNSPMKIEIEYFRKPYFSQIIYNTNYQPKAVIFDNADCTSQNTSTKSSKNELNKPESESKANREESSSRVQQIRISFTEKNAKRNSSKDYMHSSKNCNPQTGTIENRPSIKEQENFSFNQRPEEIMHNISPPKKKETDKVFSDAKTGELEIALKFSQVVNNESNKASLPENPKMPPLVQNSSISLSCSCLDKFLNAKKISETNKESKEKATTKKSNNLESIESCLYPKEFNQRFKLSSIEACKSIKSECSVSGSTSSISKPKGKYGKQFSEKNHRYEYPFQEEPINSSLMTAPTAFQPSTDINANRVSEQFTLDEGEIKFPEQMLEDNFKISVNIDQQNDDLPDLSLDSSLDLTFADISDIIDENVQLSDITELLEDQFCDISDNWSDNTFSNVLDLLYCEKRESDRKIRDVSQTFMALDDADLTSESIKLLCPELSICNFKLLDNSVDLVNIDCCGTGTPFTSAAAGAEKSAIKNQVLPCTIYQTNLAAIVEDVANPIHDLDERLDVNISLASNLSQVYDNDSIRLFQDLTIGKPSISSLPLQNTQQSTPYPSSEEKPELASLPQREKIVQMIKSSSKNLNETANPRPSRTTNQKFGDIYSLQLTSSSTRIPGQKLISLDETGNISETENSPTKKQIQDIKREALQKKFSKVLMAGWNSGSFSGENVKTKIPRRKKNPKDKNECDKGKKEPCKSKDYCDSDKFLNFILKYEGNKKLEQDRMRPCKKKDNCNKKISKSEETSSNSEESDNNQILKYAKNRKLQEGKVKIQNTKELWHHQKNNKQSVKFLPNSQFTLFNQGQKLENKVKSHKTNDPYYHTKSKNTKKPTNSRDSLNDENLNSKLKKKKIEQPEYHKTNPDKIRGQCCQKSEKMHNSEVNVMNKSNSHRSKYFEKEKSEESKTQPVDFKDRLNASCGQDGYFKLKENFGEKKYFSNSSQSKEKGKFKTFNILSHENLENSKNQIDLEKLKLKMYGSKIMEISRIEWDPSISSKNKNDSDDEWYDIYNDDYKRDKISKHKYKSNLSQPKDNPKQKLEKYYNKSKPNKLKHLQKPIHRKHKERSQLHWERDDDALNQRQKKNKHKKRKLQVDGVSSNLTQLSKLPISIRELENQIPGITDCLGNIKLTGLQTPVPGIDNLKETNPGFNDLFAENIALSDVTDFVEDLNDKLPEFTERLDEKLPDIRLPAITGFLENPIPVVSNMFEETFPRLTDMINNTAVLPCITELYDEAKITEPWKDEVQVEECCNCEITECDEFFFSRTPWGSTLDQATVGILRAISLFAPHLFDRLAIQRAEDQANEEDKTGLRATIQRCVDFLHRHILGPTIIESVLQLVEGINYITTTIYGPNESYESSSCCQKRRNHYTDEKV